MFRTAENKKKVVRKVATAVNLRLKTMGVTPVSLAQVQN